MSMLAEPRRKQKWSVDPRNSAWSKDDSKFGQKMLERMGWSKGEGLGRSGQGSTDHIKVRVKNDSYGLGANAADEDKWISHQDDFNELLAELNNQHGQNNNSTAPQSEESKGFSLEEKSKKASKRVHYMKFTKGKDLSSRTETDLNCIFGKRAKPTKAKEQVSNTSDSGDQDETIGETKTVTSTLSMQEYFAQRMAQLKRGHGQAQSEAPAAETEEMDLAAEPSEEPSPVSSGGEDSEKPKKEKKKKKKSKRAAEKLEEAENCSAPISQEEDELEQQEHAGKKKKKRKMVENEGAAIEDCGAASGGEQNCEELPPSKKQKKKKQRKEDREEELLNGHTTAAAEDQTAEVVEKKKKKKKKKQQQQQQEEEDGEEAEEVMEQVKEETSEKKSKKAKKRKQQ
ncbi:PIN2/TERF1-interacting telomerase inhibitor 1 [Nelusetta ayraudi]|uniref:PIN2/TERF1-interacting telomerase inhibitor 1 n=1 Tax=Nelusetta ayraudi TaxID=303726 RepID=UPI003F6FAE98